MELSGKKIGFAMTGSYCTFKTVLEQLRILKKKGAELYPIVSENVARENRKRCPWFFQALPIVLENHGKQVSVRPATNSSSYGNELQFFRRRTPVPSETNPSSFRDEL